MARLLVLWGVDDLRKTCPHPTWDTLAIHLDAFGVSLGAEHLDINPITNIPCIFANLRLMNFQVVSCR